tara:strand:+ start:80 stop:427 length:348 start_codon:yes stop_codon:yes gene_type:complete
MNKNKNLIEKKIKNYFSFFSKKKLEELANLFSSGIILQDWTTKLKGKKKVKKFNSNLFKKFKKIEVNLKESFFDNSKMTAACRLKIKLDNKKIDVVDIIYFDKKFKIKKIIAYLG